MATHSSTLAWKIPWTEEPGRLESMGSPRVGHNWVTSLSLFTSCIGEGNSNPLRCSCLENPRDGKAWWAAIYGVAQSQTQLKRLSSSSSSRNIQTHVFYKHDLRAHFTSQMLKHVFYNFNVSHTILLSYFALIMGCYCFTENMQNFNFLVFLSISLLFILNCENIKSEH